MATIELKSRSYQTSLGVLCVLSLVAFCGCKRGFYRRTADQDTYNIIAEKGAGPTWHLQPGFTVEPDQRSRFFDPTCRTDPRLPAPAPQLYNYQVPLLATPEPPKRNLAGKEDTSIVNDLPPVPSRAEENKPPFDAAPPNDRGGNGAVPPAVVPPPASQLLPGQALPSASRSTNVHLSTDSSQRNVQSLRPPQSVAANDHQNASPSHTASLVRDSTAVITVSALTSPVVTTATPLQEGSLQLSESAPQAGIYSPQSDSDADGNQRENEPEEVAAGSPLMEEFGQEFIFRIPPIPADAWQTLPDSCVRRMLEFDTVRTEYEKTFQRSVTESQLDPAKRVSLENILEIALINSREYQTRKETLYRVALQLTLRRFDYDLKFIRGGNRSTLGYTHNRSGGIEVNTLTAPTDLGITRSLYTAGELTARFANDVVLTFNGANGYSSSVSSGLLFELTQPLIQRDIQFEPLTQAERNVVYAARDFVQYRKQLFRDLAVRYYNLLLTYRSIAINTQDYFSNLGGFNRASAVYQTGSIPRFQVDQFEQNALRSRGNLINSCNSLERSLDQLKFTVGLPPELPLNIDLSELESLTLADEATVIREQIRRARLYSEQQVVNEDVSAAVSATAELARRMLSLSVNNRTLGLVDDDKVAELELWVAHLEAEDKRLEAAQNARVLQQDSAGEARALPAQIFLRNKDVMESTLESIQRELKLLGMLTRLENNQRRNMAGAASDKADPSRETQTQRTAQGFIDIWETQVTAFKRLGAEQLEMPYAEQSEKLPGMIKRAEALLISIQQLEHQVVDELEVNGLRLVTTSGELLALAASVIQASSDEFFSQPTGLSPLVVDMDEAMLTALVQRLDLMNRRGELADDWRQIKYTGDALRSVLNVRASQSIRTPNLGNKPFEFSFDNSTTNLALDFDSPLNRRLERNAYRTALINYNVALRNLIEAEDNVKLDIRNDLREIALDQNQYEISIASAALAYERVASTRLQLATGQGNVSARDFLEAQQAYTQSLSDVATQHIGYIVDRIQFFLDLEQLQVDQVNFWPELRNEDYPFLPNSDFGGSSPAPYGSLPCGPWYSDCLRRMEQIPPGVATSKKTPEQ